MKTFCIFILSIFSIGAFAVDRNYDCKKININDRSLPKSFYLQVENKVVSLQDDSDDIYYKGTIVKRIEEGSKIARGFEGLIRSHEGMMIIGKGIFSGLSKSTISIFDPDLEVTQHKYICVNLNS